MLTFCADEKELQDRIAAAQLQLQIIRAKRVGLGDREVRLPVDAGVDDDDNSETDTCTDGDSQETVILHEQSTNSAGGKRVTTVPSFELVCTASKNALH